MGRVVSIPAGLSFVDTLARMLLIEAGTDPLRLAEALVLLPNRRACRALRDAFLRQSGGQPLLLPRLRPIDGSDEDEADFAEEGPLDIPPAMPPLRRILLLARQVIALGEARGGRAPTADQAVRLARELAALIDSVQIEELDFAGLERLVPETFAGHWQETIRFLEIVTAHWPVILAENKAIDPQERVRRVIDAQAETWRKHPPVHPVIAAGSTGTRPATARLLGVIAGLPSGMVILPGLDRHLDPESWAAIEDTHPQAGMKRLLERLGLERTDVADAVPAPGGPLAERVRLLAEALRPAATCAAWRDLPAFSPQTLNGMTRQDAPAQREEAGAIALMMRQALEVPNRTAALVTPDRDLAQRVAAELERWKIAIDDSAGRPLALSEPGAFLRLLVAAVAQDFAPHACLALFKHPLAAGGIEAAHFRANVRRLELTALRGPRPAPGINGLKSAAPADLHPWLEGILAAAGPFARMMQAHRAEPADLVQAHMELAEWLAADITQPGPARLWRGEAGTALARFAADLAEASTALGSIAPAAYPALFDEMLTGQVVRPIWGRHPRLFIWGPLEARLQQADLTILGGLNEGSWPAAAETDPWMSRPMRKDFGLAPPERRIGLSAHDFAQSLAAPRVVLSRSLRAEGTPTRPSRWLMRLDAVLLAAGLAEEVRAGHPPRWKGEDSSQWLEWHAALDRPDSFERIRPPAPRPPVAARPRTLSVTEIETWMRDPYAIYAKHVLRLKALAPIDQDPGAADYGSLMHKAIQIFIETYPDRLPADPKAALITIGETVFEATLARPGLWAFWWPRFNSACAWLAAKEIERRLLARRICPELAGAIDIGSFRLTARADRVEVLKDGSLALIDYKTGAVPTKKEVAAGFAPQLPLEAVIAREGGFAAIGPAPVAELLYWRLKGGKEGGEESHAGDDPATLADEAKAGLAALVALYDDEATAYPARPHPDFAPRYSDYLHLARLNEWADDAGEDAE